jgi:hypothetical protein
MKIKKAREANLDLTNSYPEWMFIQKFGQNLFDKLKQEALIIDNYRCAGCDHQPPHEKINSHLEFHICHTFESEIDINHPELIRGVTLCKACHTTQHIQAAINFKHIILVNSVLSQSRLVQSSRSGQIHGVFTQRQAIKLKMTPEEFLNKYLIGEARITPTLKATFTNEFFFDDL